MGQIYDISNYIILLRQFNLLNSIIKKMYVKDELYPSKQFKKINVNDNDIINKVNSELNSDKSILFSHYGMRRWCSPSWGFHPLFLNYNFHYEIEGVRPF